MTRHAEPAERCKAIINSVYLEYARGALSLIPMLGFRCSRNPFRWSGHSEWPPNAMRCIQGTVLKRNERSHKSKQLCIRTRRGYIAHSGLDVHSPEGRKEGCWFVVQYGTSLALPKTAPKAAEHIEDQPRLVERRPKAALRLRTPPRGRYEPRHAHTTQKAKHKAVCLALSSQL